MAAMTATAFAGCAIAGPHLARTRLPRPECAADLPPRPATLPARSTKLAARPATRAPRGVAAAAAASAAPPAGRRQALGLAAAALVAALAPAARADLTADLLEKSTANKAANDKARLAASYANLQRSRSVADGSCAFPNNVLGCDVGGYAPSVKFIGEEAKIIQVRRGAAHPPAPPRPPPPARSPRLPLLSSPPAGAAAQRDPQVSGGEGEGGAHGGGGAPRRRRGNERAGRGRPITVSAVLEQPARGKRRRRARKRLGGGQQRQELQKPARSAGS
jgi:photosystem I subunit PsaN